MLRDDLDGQDAGDMGVRGMSKREVVYVYSQLIHFIV